MTALVARPLPSRRAGQPRQSLLATAQARLMVMLLIFGALFLLAVLRVASLGISFDEVDAATKAAHAATARRDIVDRNGTMLARTIETFKLGVHPAKLLGDRTELAHRLAELIPEHDARWYLDRLTSKASFTPIARNVPAETVNAVHALGEPGIVRERETERLYPQGMLAAHVLGFIGQSKESRIAAPRAGMELALNSEITDPLYANRPVALSIDARTQAAVENELGHAMAEYRAKGAVGIVLDANTGELVSLASLPVFNPNQVGRARADAFRNNALQVFELGSTFKPITMAIAMDTGTVTSMSRRFDATEPLRFGRFTINDFHAQRRFLNIPETLVHSSNIATAKIAELIGREKMQQQLEALGFKEKPHIELLEKNKPQWPSYWGETAQATVSYGHGMSVSPLHLANAYAALVNGGVLRPATLRRLAPGTAPAGRRVFSEETSARMRQLLRLVVLKGSGKSANVPGYRVGGKTGTAEVSMKAGYNKSSNVSTFAAAFPMDAPRYIIVVTLVAPQGSARTGGATTAGAVAAPVVARIIERTAPMLGIMPDMTRDVDVGELMPLLWEAKPSANAGPANSVEAGTGL